METMDEKHFQHTPDGQTWVRRLERVYDAAVAVAGAHDVDSALQIIVNSAREVAGAELAALGVPSQLGEPMAHFVISGLSAEDATRAGHAPMGRGVLGLILTGEQSLRLSNVADHPSFGGYPAAHPHIRAFLGVPIRSAGEVIGDLYLANKVGGEIFDETDQHMIEMLAAHAAAVILNLRYQHKASEVARMRDHEATGRALQDDVLQTLYGSGLLLAQVDLGDKTDAETRLKQVQASLGQAIDHLRAHLLALSPPPDE
jgi:signal transduction protein with GAF and PtsI domain